LLYQPRVGAFEWDSARFGALQPGGRYDQVFISFIIDRGTDADSSLALVRRDFQH
jgi:hypothetical protein